MDDPTARARELYTDRLHDQVFGGPDDDRTDLEKLCDHYEGDIDGMIDASSEIFAKDNAAIVEMFTWLLVLSGKTDEKEKALVAQKIGEILIESAEHWGARL